MGKLTVEYLELLRADGKPIEIDPSSSILTRAKQIEMKFKEYSELCKSITESYKEAEKKVFILLLSVVKD